MHKSFACGHMKELAESFPDLKDHLLDIAGHIVDPETPFSGGYVYNRAMEKVWQKLLEPAE